MVPILPNVITIFPIYLRKWSRDFFAKNTFVPDDI